MDVALLEMEYTDGQNRHTFRLHVRPVDPAPVGPFDNLLYLPYTTALGAEGGILQTFESFAVRWAAYYPDSWALSLIAVWGFEGPQGTLLGALPTAPTVSAAIVPAPPSYHSTRRVLRVRSSNGVLRRLYLMQVNGTQISRAVAVTPTSGGFDARDQALIAYLSAPTSAAVGPDGLAILPTGQVSAQWDRPTT